MGLPAGMGVAIAQGGFSIGGNLFTHRENKKAWERTKDLYLENREYELGLANSEIQRRVNDLKAAGLNPMLAYMDSASTPHSSAPQSESYAKGMDFSGVSSAAMAKMQAEQIKESTNNIRIDSSKKDAERNLLETQADKEAAQTQLIDLTAQEMVPKIWSAHSNAKIAEQNIKNVEEEFKKISEQVKNIRSERENIELASQVAVLEILARQAGLPAMQNEQWFDETWYGKYVRPLLKDVGKVSGAITSGVGAAIGGAIGARRGSKEQKEEKVREERKNQEVKEYFK